MSLSSDAQAALDTCLTLLSSLKVSGDKGRAQFQSTLHPEGKMCHARYDRGGGVFFHNLDRELLQYCEKAFDGTVKMEEIVDGEPTVLVDHDIAMVWTPYSVRYDAELSHVGTNCFNLTKVCKTDRDGEMPEENNWEWKIVVLNDTARKATPEEKTRLDKEYAAQNKA